MEMRLDRSVFSFQSFEESSKEKGQILSFSENLALITQMALQTTTETINTIKIDRTLTEWSKKNA